MPCFKESDHNHNKREIQIDLNDKEKFEGKRKNALARDVRNHTEFKSINSSKADITNLLLLQ